MKESYESDCGIRYNLSMILLKVEVEHRITTGQVKVRKESRAERDEPYCDQTAKALQWLWVLEEEKLRL